MSVQALRQPSPTPGPTHSPPPPHSPQEACSHNDGERCKVVAMHADKMTVPTQGSDCHRTSSAACILPVDSEGERARAWRPSAVEGDNKASDASEARGGVSVYDFLLTAPRTPGRHRSRPGSCGGKVRDPPPVKSSSRGIKPARVRGHVAGPGGAYMASGPRRRRSRT